MKAVRKYLLPIVIVGSAVLFFVFTQENRMYSFSMTTALSMLLLIAYQLGAGAGSMLGTLLGAIMTLMTGDIGTIGIFACMGVMAGAFQALGRWASCIAFLLGGIEIGVLYAPDLLQQYWTEAFVAIFIFLLLPREWFKIEKKEKTKYTPMDIYDGEGLLGKKIGRVAEAFDFLGKSMLKTGNEYAFSDGYLGEVRETAADQYIELSRLLESFREELSSVTALTREEENEKKIKKCLKGKQIQTEQMTLLKQANLGKTAILTLYTENGTCVTAREVGEMVSRELNCKLRPSEDCRTVITGQPSLIRLEEEPHFYMIHAVARATKTKEEISGDCFSFMPLPNGNHLMAVCDGMGSGERAASESKRVIELTEHFMEAGFSPTSVIRLVNNALMLQNEDPHPITMDLIKIDLRCARCSFIKAGASISCIRRGDKVEVLQTESLPMGSISKLNTIEKMYRLQSGDFIIMVTDGVVEAFSGEEKEAAFCNYILNLKLTNPKDMANHILLYAMSQNPDEVTDDMLVLVAAIYKKTEGMSLPKEL